VLADNLLLVMQTSHAEMTTPSTSYKLPGIFSLLSLPDCAGLYLEAYLPALGALGPGNH